MFDCYNSEKHDCDGRCQGCSDCIMHKWKRKPSRNEMLKYMKKVEENNKAWDEYAKELEKDEEFQNEIKIFYKKIGY